MRNDKRCVPCCAEGEAWQMDADQDVEKQGRSAFKGAR